MKQLSRILLIAAALMLVFLCMADTASACPTCKDGMAGDPAYSSMVNGYFWSILFMMSMPFLVFGGVASYFYYEVRRARARQAAEAHSSSNDGPADASSKPEIALLS
ncbi:MAG: hypothetical protein WD070_09895 [Pirellulaceae bacterium]